MPEDSRNTEKRHPIQVVARRTGLTPDLLRAWEKRYGVVEPGRSEGGRRLYSDQDIERLRLLHRATRAGRRIGRVAPLSTEELTAMVREDEREEAEAVLERRGPDAVVDGHRKAALEAMGRLDARELESVLGRAMVMLSAPVLIEEVAAPLLERVGELWSEGEVRPAHEHMLSAVLLRVLGRLIEAAGPPRIEATVVVATPSGLTHEFGALFVAATAAAEGWRVAYLGCDLPAADIAAVAQDLDAEAVALSIVYPAEAAEVKRELRELRRQLPPDKTLLVGGRAAESYRDVLDEMGAVVITEMEGLRTQLRELAGVAKTIEG